MNDTATRTYHPPNALLMWTDGRTIFVELPSTSGPPCIISYRYSDGGLSKALALLGKHADIAGAPISIPPPRLKKETPQQAMAQSILTKMGLIK